MNVKLLGMNGTDLLHYSSEPEKAIIHIMTYGSSTLIMEPGELADFAQGHRLLTNSKAKIVTLNEGDTYLAPEGDYFHIFLPVTVKTSMIKEGNSFRSIRILESGKTLPWDINLSQPWDVNTGGYHMSFGITDSY
ncbi:hypothetical protein U9527_21115 [Escherichia coli]